jgi:hypothetical protein
MEFLFLAEQHWEHKMNIRFALALVAGLGVCGALPASAEEVGVGVTVGSPHVDRDRDGDRDKKVVVKKDHDRDDKKVVIKKDRDRDVDKKVTIKKDND